MKKFITLCFSIVILTIAGCDKTATKQHQLNIMQDGDTQLTLHNLSFHPLPQGETIHIAPAIVTANTTDERKQSVATNVGMYYRARLIDTLKRQGAMIERDASLATLTIVPEVSELEVNEQRSQLETFQFQGEHVNQGGFSSREGVTLPAFAKIGITTTVLHRTSPALVFETTKQKTHFHDVSNPWDSVLLLTESAANEVSTLMTKQEEPTKLAQ